MVTKVTLRQKPIAGNKQSLYLDFYPAIMNYETEKPTRREFLGFHIFDNPKNPTDKKHNKETLQVAEQIRQRKQNELDKPEIYSEQEKELLRVKKLGEKDFISFFAEQVEKRTNSTLTTWESSLKHLKTYTKGSLQFKDVTAVWLNDFRNYLLNTNLATNSVILYLSQLKTVLRQAHKNKLMPDYLGEEIESIKKEDTHRDFLTIEEMNKLIKADCRKPIVKQAAIFSALTGLRYSDCEKLKWSEVQANETGYFLDYSQQKTKNKELLPISEQAVNLLGERKEPTDRVFKGLIYSKCTQNIPRWLAAAGINKDITFHCFRHTYATLQLSQGTDIYTVSKMLGHHDLKTTQIYAKVMEKAKRDAAEKVQFEF